jgi:hypothetical protein
MTTYGYAIAKISDATAGSGTLSGSATATAITGSSTAFTNELAVGDFIIANGQTRVVETISDNTHLTITVALTTTLSSSAFTYIHPINVETLASPARAPIGEFEPFAEAIDLADGLVRGGGAALARWRWDFIERDLRNALRVYCSGASATIYIQTLVIDGYPTYASYIADAIWPSLTESKRGNKRTEFILEFRNLVQAVG